MGNFLLSWDATNQWQHPRKSQWQQHPQHYWSVAPTSWKWCIGTCSFSGPSTNWQVAGTPHIQALCHTCGAPSRHRLQCNWGPTWLSHLVAGGSREAHQKWDPGATVGGPCWVSVPFLAFHGFDFHVLQHYPEGTRCSSVHIGCQSLVCLRNWKKAHQLVPIN